jgi:hypothetical protein
VPTVFGRFQSPALVQTASCAPTAVTQASMMSLAYVRRVSGVRPLLGEEASAYALGGIQNSPSLSAG